MWVSCRANADRVLGSDLRGAAPLINGFCALLCSLGFRTFGSTTAGLDAFVHGGEWFEIRGGFVARAVLVVADVVFGLLHSGFGIGGFGCWRSWGCC